MFKTRIAILSVIVTLALAMTAGAAEEHYPIGHPDQGLPHPDFTPTPYHPDPNHALNRVFRAGFLARLIPAEVGLALPREHGDPVEFFRGPWYFAVRRGISSDRRLFGGDGRLLSREGFTPDEAAIFVRGLAETDGEGIRTLKTRPELAVFFQHDLLRVAQRLMDTGRNRQLLRPLASAVQRVALPSHVLSSLPSTYELGLPFKNPGPFLPADLLRMDPSVKGAYVELLRSSTRVFDASRTLAWSRVFIAWPTTRDDLAVFLSANGKGSSPNVPVGTRSVLVQGIVAVDDQGRPQATPLVFDVRIKWLANRDPLSAQNRTTSRDGIQIRAFELRRASLREGPDDRLFRTLQDEDQFLFRDYGTLKHTTLAAQCTLCHRLTGVDDARLGGFIVLSPSAKPAPASTGAERLRLAETEVSKFLSEFQKASGR
jgi:hypothetical protein